MINVQPFRIVIQQEALDDLAARLRHTRWPDEITGSGWEYGARLSYLKRLFQEYAAAVWK